MSSPVFRLTALVVALACVGCLKPPTKPVAEGTVKGPKATSISLDSGTLLGQAMVPVIAAGGGNVIAAGGGNVIAAGGGNVIAAGGGNVIAAGGGNVIAAGGGNFRVLATAGSADEELPVYGAAVILRDPVTRKRIPWAQPVATDAQGRFKFEKLPARVNYLVEVVFIAKDRTPFRLLSLTRPGNANQTTRVSWRSMALATAMLNQAKDSKGLYVTDPARLAAAETELKKAFDGLVGDALAQKLRQAITVPQAAMSAPGAEGQAPDLVVPDELPMQVVAGATTMVEESATRLPSLNTELKRAAQTMAVAPAAEEVKVVEAATAIMVNQTAPTLTAGRIVYDPVLVATPSPSPSTSTVLVQRTAAPTLVLASPSSSPIAAVTLPATQIALVSPSPTPLVLKTIAPTIILASPSPSPTTTITQPITRLASPSPTPLVIKTLAPISRFP